MPPGSEQDSYVQVATDGTGKKVDNATLTREPVTVGGTGDTVYRQRVVIGADDNPRQQVGVSGEAGRAVLQVEARNEDMLHVLIEIRDLLRLFAGQ